MFDFASRPLKNFLEKLGSCDPAPGGGGAAAVVIAQAAALAEMVARLNCRRSEKQGIKNPPSLKNIRPLAAIRRESLALLERDAKIFSRLSKFKKEARGKAGYLRVLELAAGIPGRMCLLAERGIVLAASETSRTSRWLYSDLLESAIFFEAGFQAARLNVEVNLKEMPDKKRALRMTAGLSRISQRIKRIRKEIGEE